MSVEEKLATSRVPEAQSLGLVAEQCAGKPVQSSTLCLEALSADVDDEPLAAAGRAAVILLQYVRLRRRHAELVIRRRRESDFLEHRGERRGAERGGRSGLVVEDRTGERRRRRRRAVVKRMAALLGRIFIFPGQLPMLGRRSVAGSATCSSSRHQPWRKVPVTRSRT